MLRRLIRQFIGDRRATILAETAILMPVLTLVLFGGIEVSRYALLQQKLNRTVVATSDLVSQIQGTINETQIANLFESADYVMRPFALGDNGNLIVTSVVQDPGDSPKVMWQCRRAGSFAPASELGVAGATATLPAGFILRDGESFIYAEVIMNYEPFLFGQFLGAQQLRYHAVFRPRFTALRTLLPPPTPPSVPAVCASAP